LIQSASGIWFFPWTARQTFRAEREVDRRGLHPGVDVDDAKDKMIVVAGHDL
jgi:hypothetical protein